MRSIHTELKQATQQLHARLDSMPPMRRLMRTDLRGDEYVAVLLQLEPWLSQMASYLEQLSLPPYALAEHKRQALRADLSLLGVHEQSVTAVSASIDPAFALGVHYVVEGSTMGARILAPRIEAALNRTDVTCFYRLYGEQTLEHWSETLKLLETEITTEQQLAAAIEGAKFSFTSLIEGFQQTEQLLDPSNLGVAG